MNSNFYALFFLLIAAATVIGRPADPVPTEIVDDRNILEKAVDKTKEVASDVGGAVKNTYNKITGQTEEQQAADKVKEGVDTVADKTHDARVSAGDKLNAAGEKISETATDAKNSAGEKLNAAGEKISETAKDAKDAAGEKLNAAGDKLQEARDRAADSMNRETRVLEA